MILSKYDHPCSPKGGRPHPCRSPGPGAGGAAAAPGAACLGPQSCYWFKLSLILLLLNTIDCFVAFEFCCYCLFLMFLLGSFSKEVFGTQVLKFACDTLTQHLDRLGQAMVVWENRLPHFEPLQVALNDTLGFSSETGDCRIKKVTSSLRKKTKVWRKELWNGLMDSRFVTKNHWALASDGVMCS